MKKTVISLSVIVAAMSFGTMSEVCAAKKPETSPVTTREAKAARETKAATVTPKVFTDKNGDPVAVVGRDSKGGATIGLNSPAIAAATTKNLPPKTPVVYNLKGASGSVVTAVQGAAAQSGAGVKTDGDGTLHVTGTANQVFPVQQAAADAAADPFNLNGAGAGAGGELAGFIAAAMGNPPATNTNTNTTTNNTTNNSGAFSGDTIGGKGTTITFNQGPRELAMPVDVAVGVRTKVTDEQGATGGYSPGDYSYDPAVGGGSIRFQAEGGI